MNTSELTVKIENLPDDLKKMAEDYIDYLLDKANKQASADSKWSEVLTARARQSEQDIKAGKVSSQEEVRKDFLKMIEAKKSK